MAYFYAAYGLTIQASFPLPELVPFGLPADHTNCDISIWATADAVEVAGLWARLYWSAIGTFWIRDAREIIYVAAPAATEPAARLALLGTVFAALLHQRGYLPLHASAVALPNEAGNPEAVGFLGDSRQGKSTLAAAFHARGQRVVNDDILALPPAALAALTATPAALLPWVYPGFPTLKLWPEASAALFDVPEALQPAPFAAQHDRRVRDVSSAFSLDALPLRRLYVLADGPEIASERLSRQLAIQQLLRQAYWTPRLPPQEKATLLRQCVTLTQHLEVYRLWRPRNLARLPEVVAFIEAEIAATAQPLATPDPNATR